MDTQNQSEEWMNWFIPGDDYGSGQNQQALCNSTGNNNNNFSFLTSPLVGLGFNDNNNNDLSFLDVISAAKMANQYSSSQATNQYSLLCSEQERCSRELRDFEALHSDLLLLPTPSVDYMDSTPVSPIVMSSSSSSTQPVSQIVIANKPKKRKNRNNHNATEQSLIKRPRQTIFYEQPPVPAALPSLTDPDEQLKWFWTRINDNLAYQRRVYGNVYIPERQSKNTTLIETKANFPLQLPLILKAQYLGVQMEIELLWAENAWYNGKSDLLFIRLPVLPQLDLQLPQKTHIQGTWHKHPEYFADFKPVWFTSLGNAWRKIASMIRGKAVSACGELKFLVNCGGEWCSIADLQHALLSQSCQISGVSPLSVLGPHAVPQSSPLFRNPQYGTNAMQCAFRNDCARQFAEPTPSYLQEFSYIANSKSEDKVVVEEQEEQAPMVIEKPKEDDNRRITRRQAASKQQQQEVEAQQHVLLLLSKQKKKKQQKTVEAKKIRRRQRRVREYTKIIKPLLLPQFEHLRLKGIL